MVERIESVRCLSSYFQLKKIVVWMMEWFSMMKIDDNYSLVEDRSTWNYTSLMTMKTKKNKV